VTDFSAVGAAGLAVIGHRLGLYRALEQSPATPERFAERDASTAAARVDHLAERRRVPSQ
jgi:hypothetical protein